MSAEAAPSTTTSGRHRSVEDVRAYLLDQINLALRRLGMYGGETALILFFDTLAHLERRDEEWKAERELLRTRGALTSIGVPGAFAYMLPEGKRDDGAVASVYAEVARRFDWLRIDRVLTESEQIMLVERAGRWAADDRSLSDLLDTWGQPSAWLGGTNDLYPKTLAYAVDDREAPLVCFHLWNRIEPTPESPVAGVFKQPMLLAVRHGAGRFEETLTFTPEGARRRPPA